jgi:hypothetical protein
MIYSLYTKVVHFSYYQVSGFPLRAAEYRTTNFESSSGGQVSKGGIARAAQSLPQHQRLRGVCAACRAFYL